MKVQIILILIIILIILYFYNYKKYEKFNTNIPKIIIQTWKDNNIPDKYYQDIKSVKHYNRNFEFKFFTDNDIYNFINNFYPQYLNTYNTLPITVQKIDFFRYIAIYHYGGFYYDLDITATDDLNDLLDNECVFPIDTNITEINKIFVRYNKYYNQNINFLLGQYAFGAKPKNKFIKLLIDTINDNCDNYKNFYNTYYNQLNPTEKNQFVYSSTGPDFVTDMYAKYENKKSIKILYHDYGQYFGKYAKHNHYGTWK